MSHAAGGFGFLCFYFRPEASFVFISGDFKEFRLSHVIGNFAAIDRALCSFPTTQILREINFGDSRSAKSAVFAILEALNFDFS